jgi:TP53 regulating kinase and related kinases
MTKIIQQGAEATIYKIGNKVVKDRIPKKYRLPILDQKIIKQRTKREAKVLDKVKSLIPVPALLSDPKTQGRMIHMEFIEGKKLSEHLDSLPDSEEVCKTIGSQISILHDNEIIHGDLTTSNMILSSKDSKLYFIDFGLSFNSSRKEDKATDLHLIKQALEAKHFSHFEKFFSAIIEGYKSSEFSSGVLKQLEKVEARGRYRKAQGS